MYIINNMKTIKRFLKWLFCSKPGWALIFIIWAVILDASGQTSVFIAAIVGAVLGIAIYNWGDNVKKLPRIYR